MGLAAAFLRRDMRLMRSYRLQLFMQIFGVLITLVSYHFLALLVPARQSALQPYASDYFTFVMIGTGAATFFTVGLGSFAEALGREQTSGTLEALLVSPNGARRLLLAGALWPVCFAVVNLALYIALGVVVFNGHVAADHLLLVAGMLALSLAAFSALGLLAAATLIQVKRGTVVVGLTGSLFGLLGGVLYPVSVLPGWLGVLAHLLPVTYGLDGVRQALLTSPDGGRLLQDCLALVGFIAVLAPAAMLMVTWSLRRARIDGSLAQY